MPFQVSLFEKNSDRGIQDFINAVETTIYPRADFRVRLSDFKVELGTRGLEQTMPVEVYHSVEQQWKKAKWNTPLPVETPGQALLVRFAGVMHLEGFDEFLPWAFPMRMVGKGRAY